MADDTSSTPRGGRPPGSGDTPAKMLAREMRDTTALAIRTRGLMEKRLRAIEHMMDAATTTPEQMMDLTAQLGSILQVLARGIETTGKLLMAPTRPAVDPDSGSATPADILRELSGGVTPKKR